jgi:DNA-binding response OmpR family regulator/class 3 adenylate cyclase/predicted ATPase
MPKVRRGTLNVGMKKRVMVVAQDTALRARIARLLQPAGYAVELSASEKRALELSANEAIDSAIIVTGATVAGIAFARQIGDRLKHLIVLTEAPQDVAKIKRSLPGADVYQSLDQEKLLKRLAELMPSVDSATVAPTETTLQVGDCRIDLAGRTFVHADGREVALTRAEFSLLMVLARNAGRVLSRDELNHAIAGRDAEPYGRGVDMQIRRLRSKIETDPTAPRFILTVSGAGYKFAGESRVVSPTSDLETETSGKLPVSSPNSASERRHLTVLSCALAGPAASTADVDPEEFAAASQSFREACAATIVKHGGRIASSTGHEILALFGYPEAHEDDAERAVYAGLDFTAGIAGLAWPSGEPLQMRAGVATGLVVITDQGAFGEPTTVAPHLRDAASPNSILITAGTRKLIGHAFVCEPPVPYELAGVSGKVSACLVTGRLPVESRFSSKRGPRLTQFIGREQELQQLSTLWDRVKAGNGQVALLCGEAGIGKSRACEVFLERVAAEPHVRMLYQCAPHHANSPFYPIIEQLERVANFKPGDAPNIKLDKLAATLSVTGAVTPADIRTCAVLMSIPTGETPAPAAAPQRQKEITIDVLLRVILALSRKEAMVLELADAHWADSSTLELFGRLIASIPAAPVFVLISFRPEFIPPWLDQPHVTMLRLDRLEREQTEAIVFDIAGQKAMPAEMTAQIIAKTDGIPLFVEELTRSVLESGALQDDGDRLVAAGPLPSLAIPTTLLGSLTARLDRLGAAKEIAQIGAAIGREFSYRLLAAVAPISGHSLQATLAQLIVHDLIFVRGRASDAVYVFKHALVQDAAYSTLLRSKRQQLHGQIAHALERDFPEIVETQPELLAYHLIQAGLTERAIDYLRKAGQRSIGRSANPEAIGHLTQALKLLGSLPGGPGRRQQALGFEVMLSQAMIAVRGYAARETAEVLLRAKDLIDEQTDPAQKLAILYGVWACHYVGGEVAQQTDAAAEFLKEAERRQDNTALCVAHRIVGTTHLTKGEFAAALPHLQHARSLYDPRRPLQFQYGQDAGAAALCYLSWTLWHQGYIDQASQVAAQAIKRADELSHHPHTQVFTICHARGMMDIFQRRSADMTSYARSVIALCREHGFSHWLACGRILEGWAAVHRGETEKGIEIVGGGVAAWRSAGAGLWLPLFLMLLAEAFSMAGSNETALTVIDQAIAIAEQTGERWCLAEILRIKAGLVLATDQASEQVEILLAWSLHVARSQNARCWELRAACDLASLWQRKDRAKDALLLLQPVYAQFTEGFESTDLQSARRILDGLEAGPGAAQEKSNTRKGTRSTP